MPAVLPEIGLALTAMLAGVILFFSLAVAPLVFRTLEPDDAGRLIRRAFPVYYLVIIAAAAPAAICFAGADSTAAVIMTLVAVGSVIARHDLMPRINRHRDAANAGADGAAKAERAFNRLHRLSVWINGAQLIGVLAVVAMRIAA
jgi:hypothetical protein